MKSFNRIICLLTLFVLLFSFAACGTEEGPAVTLSITLQNEAIAEGESNSVLVTHENAGEKPQLVYQIKRDNGAFEDAWTSTATAYTFTPELFGSYEIRVMTELDGTKYYSNTATFTVTAISSGRFGKSQAGDNPTANVDLSGDALDASGMIVHRELNKISDEYAFYRELYSDRFVFSADINIVSENGGDPHPKAGLFAKAGSTFYCILFDVKPDFSGRDLIYTEGSAGNWEWGKGTFDSKADFRPGGMSVTHRLTMLRNVQDFYFFVDGSYIGTAYVPHLIAGVKTVIGTYTMAQHAEYTNYIAYDGGSDEFAHMLQLGESQADDVDGILLGNTSDGKLRATAGFDFTNEQTHISQTKIGDQYAYFKGIYATRYMVKVDAGNFAALGGDRWPKFGILAARTDSSSQIAAFSLDVDMTVAFTDTENLDTIAFSKKSDGNWDWHNIEPTEQREDPTTGFNTYMVVRDGINFYYFLNGTCVGMRNDIVGITADTKTYAGIFSMGCRVEYKNYECTTDTNVIDAILTTV